MAITALKRTLADIQAAVPAVGGLRIAEHGRAIGRYYGANIATAFQPWRMANGTEIAAVEAYARSHSKRGEDLSPWQLFADNAAADDLVTLDRLSRTVHAINYFLVGEGSLPLVLNVDARLLETVPERHGEFFGRVLDILGVPSEQIIIEIRTTHQLDLTRLRSILASYRKHGFAIAVNAEGSIHARSLAELLKPDILMLDARGYFPDELRRHAGALVGSGPTLAVKRIETPAHADAVTTAGVDWVQGHFFDIPGATVPAT
jgi:EAL domain-containing protein (putative c-di-GMP-specific phosphodiesterase class I)